MSLSKERLIKFSSTIMLRTTMAQTNISFISNMLGIFKLESDTIDSNFDFDRFIADKEKALKPIADSLDNTNHCEFFSIL